MFTRRDWMKTAAAVPMSGGLRSLILAAPSANDLKAVVDKAEKFLAATQRDDGNFSANPRGGEPGLTALIAAALVRNGVPANNAVVAKALKYLETKVKKDGGVYEQGLSNYMTSLAIVAFKEANTDGKYDTIIDAATKYVKSLQYDEGLTEKDPKFGGAGLRQADREGPAGSLEHAVHGRCAAHGRDLEGRPNHQEGAHLHWPQPEPEERVQRSALRGEGERR